MKDEIFDIVDENDNIIGQATREECHSNPSLIHRVVHFMIINSKGQCLAHKRSEKKKGIGGGHWWCTIGGHVPTGEDVFEASIREMQEELGVTVSPLQIGREIIRKQKQTEMQYLYICLSDGPFEIDENEVDDVKFVEFKDILSLPGFRESLKIREVLDYHLDWWKALRSNHAKIISEFGIKELLFENCKLTTEGTTPAGEIIN